jgi:hypothetical protein
MGQKKKIDSLFPVNVASCILDISLFDVVEEEKLIWVDDMHGQYSVKTRYGRYKTIVCLNYLNQDMVIT